tara:strand:+ start:1257 stop:1514 length:258 start_codon:yes stop_codon:yes gene_type:complete
MMDIGDLVLWREDVLAFFLVPSSSVDNITSQIGVIIGEGEMDNREYYEIIWSTTEAKGTFSEYIFKEDMDVWFYTVPKTKNDDKV